MIDYKKCLLSRLVTIQEIESADYVKGSNPPEYDHFHEEAWELVTCLEGNIIVLRDYNQNCLSAGQIILIPPCLHHDVSMLEEDSSAFLISFTCTNGEYLRPLLDSVITVEEVQLDLFKKIIVELNATYESQNDDWYKLHLFNFVPSGNSPLGSEHLVCCYLEQIIIELLRKRIMNKGAIVRSGEIKEAMQYYFVNQVTAYIQEHLNERLTVEAIATHFHYSRSYLTTIYKLYTGLSIKEMIDRVRIRQAKTLLLEEKWSISKLSEELGFTSPQYFTNKFTKEVGVPPSQFAKHINSDSKTEMEP